MRSFVHWREMETCVGIGHRDMTVGMSKDIDAIKDRQTVVRMQAVRSWMIVMPSPLKIVN